MPNNSGGSNDRIDALLRREAQLKAAIAAEKVRRQKRREKEEERLAGIVGRVLLERAYKSDDFHLMIGQVLQSSDLSDAERSFVSRKGWI